MCTEFRTVDPKGYYQYFLSKKLRSDGRELETVREICLSIGNISSANGSSLVKIGNMTVVCGVKGELMTPPSEKPDKGYIVVNVDLPALCSAKYKSGPPSEQAQVVTQLVADILCHSGCVSEHELCIFPGRVAWCLYIDIVCLNYDGNAIDASIVAVLAALKTCKLPLVHLKGDGKEFEVAKESVNLKVESCMMATSFAVFNGDLMADPTAEEERLSDGVMTVVVDEDGNVRFIHKPGGVAIRDEQMRNCVRLAKSQKTNILKLLQICAKLE